MRRPAAATRPASGLRRPPLRTLSGKVATPHCSAVAAVKKKPSAKTAKAAAPEVLPWAPKATRLHQARMVPHPPGGSANERLSLGLKKVKTAAAKRKHRSRRQKLRRLSRRLRTALRTRRRRPRHRRLNRIRNSEFGTFQIGYVCHGGIAEGRDLACLGLPKTSCHCVYAASAASIADVLARAVGAATE